MKRPHTIINPLYLIFAFGLIISSCSNGEKSDAYGQFEATKTTISAKSLGQLMWFSVDEGDHPKAGQKVGLVDTTKLALQRDQLQAQLISTQSKITNINAQIDVQYSQLETAHTDLKRTEALHKDGAATQKQLDDVQGNYRTLQKQVQALQTQKQAIRADIDATKAQIGQVKEQIKDAIIVNPINGTVLTSYV